jgi:hypothetical protein
MPGESAGDQSQRRRSSAENLRAQAQLLNERAERAERAAEMWERGHVGEQTVGAQLERLRPSGFDVFHDVHWPGRKRANIDHVAVGPAGIFVVDAKNWSGTVTVRDGKLRQNGYHRDKEVAAAKQAGEDVGALLQLPWALHVIPVIALAGAGSGGVDQCQGVTVVGHDQLVAWATTLPPQLTPGDVLGIASHLRGAMPPASVPAPRRTLSTSFPRAPREPSARERKRSARRKTALREAVLKTFVVILVLLSAPALFAWWESHGAGVVGTVIPTPTFSVASPAPTPKTAPTFTSCTTLRAVYPAGVKRAGATNTGKKARGHRVVDDATYRANKSLDHDKDGLACEVSRKRPTGR